MNNLSLIFKSDQILINCIFQPESINFNYQIQNIKSSINFKQEAYKYLCSLKLNVNSNFEIFNNSKQSKISFALINKCENTTSTRNRYLKSQFFDFLFSRSIEQINFCKVLLIGCPDGYVYWYPIVPTENSKISTNLNNFILFNTASPILLIDTFKIKEEKSPFDALIKSKSNETTNKNEENCLFAITKSGKFYSYHFKSEVSYKISILPHNIELCTKINHCKNDYLIYSNSSNEIFAILLEDCFKATNLKPKFLDKKDYLRKINKSEKDNVLLINLSNGTSEELDLSNFLTDKLRENKSSNVESRLADVSTVKDYLTKLTVKSNEIVSYQVKIDKLNLTLKQLNILQNIRFNTNENNYFEIKKKKNTDGRLNLKILNKNAFLEDNTDCYYLLSCLRFERFDSDLSNSFLWTSYLEPFRACKINMEQYLNFNFSRFSSSNMYPSRIKLYLIFDIVNFLNRNKSLNQNWNFDDYFQYENTIGEFSVPIYEDEFKLMDFMVSLISLKDSFKVKSSPSILLNILTNKKEMSERLNKLGKIWKSISVEGLVKNDIPLINHLKENLIGQEKLSRNFLFSDLGFNFEIKKVQDVLTYSLKMELQDSLGVFSGNYVQNFANLIFCKNNFILKESDDQFQKLQTNLTNNQKQILENLVSKIEELLAQKRLFLLDNNDSKNRIDIDDDYGSHFDNSKSEKSRFYSIETLLNLIEIYLNLRHCLYS
ncbi:unnamed protein product [Brachionus calyciflorus]|uniref:Uncharacterized protein n=1 Tax=Brachionus calyciflorus TaxID=104777 RepID=A0A813M499_9BILA|nr:unnamed protein product [Brachionus calyciflorus]